MLLYVLFFNLLQLLLKINQVRLLHALYLFLHDFSVLLLFPDPLLFSLQPIISRLIAIHAWNLLILEKLQLHLKLLQLLVISCVELIILADLALNGCIVHGHMESTSVLWLDAYLWGLDLSLWLVETQSWLLLTALCELGGCCGCALGCQWFELLLLGLLLLCSGGQRLESAGTCWLEARLCKLSPTWLLISLELIRCLLLIHLSDWLKTWKCIWCSCILLPKPFELRAIGIRLKTCWFGIKWRKRSLLCLLLLPSLTRWFESIGRAAYRLELKIRRHILVLFNFFEFGFFNKFEVRFKK